VQSNVSVLDMDNVLAQRDFPETYYAFEMKSLHYMYWKTPFSKHSHGYTTSKYW